MLEVTVVFQDAEINEDPATVVEEEAKEGSLELFLLEAYQAHIYSENSSTVDLS